MVICLMGHCSNADGYLFNVSRQWCWWLSVWRVTAVVLMAICLTGHGSSVDGYQMHNEEGDNCRYVEG